MVRASVTFHIKIQRYMRLSMSMAPQNKLKLFNFTEVRALHFIFRTKSEEKNFFFSVFLTKLLPRRNSKYDHERSGSEVAVTRKIEGLPHNVLQLNSLCVYKFVILGTLRTV